MSLLNEEIYTVKAFAPATCANVAIGFDILGFALDAIGDEVTLTKRDDNKIIIAAIDAKENLPLAVEKNTAGIVIKKLCEDLQLNVGFSLHIHKGIPLSSGMGGSAASAVAALTAINGFLNIPLSKTRLAQYALLGEELASGQQHGDNIVPAFFGGLSLIRSIDPIDNIALPIPNIYCAIVHPQLQVETKQARSALKKEVALKDHIKQSANLASFIVALYQNDMQLLQQSLNDELIEHQRAHFVPGFYKIKSAAIHAGALGFSFSGSGPSLFAFAEKQSEAQQINLAMQNELQKEGIASSAWVSRMSHTAARIVEVKKRPT